MDKRLEDLFYAQHARQESARIIRDAAGHDGNGPGGTYLVSSFRQRQDLPVTASLRIMTSAVAIRLSEMGLLEPVSLSALPDCWWTVKVDAADEGLCSEHGCAFVVRTLSTRQLIERGIEVVGGPFVDGVPP